MVFTGIKGSKEIKRYQRNQPKNAVDLLVEKYVDDQLISKLSRKYFELKFGEDKCSLLFTHFIILFHYHLQ